jgi:hypothetical protein
MATSDQTTLQTSMQLTIPAEPQLLRIVRLVASGLASLSGCDLDTVEEVRVAADELVAALMEAGGGSDVTINLALADGHLSIDAAADLPDGRSLEVDPLSDRILDTVATSHAWRTEGSRAHGIVERQLR